MIAEGQIEPTAKFFGRHFLLKVSLGLALIAVAATLRFVSLKQFAIMYDEQITRAVAENIWNGDLRNNWKYAPNMPAAFRIDSYNFSSYMYADALATGKHTVYPLFRERSFSALLGTLAVVLFSLAARRLFGFQVALATLAITAVFPLLVQDAHFARPEAFVTFLCALVYLCSAMMLASPRPIRWLAGASFCCGLMIACKVSLPPMAAVPFVALIARKYQLRRSMAVWLVLLLAGLMAGIPNAFFHPKAFWNGVEALRHQYAGEYRQYSPIDSKYCFKYLLPYFWQTLGPLCCLLSVVGAAVLLWRKQFTFVAMIAAPVLFYLVFFGSQRVFFERNLSHIAPLIAILAAVGISWLASRLPHQSHSVSFAALLLLTLLIPAYVSYRLVFIALRTDVQHRAKAYEQQIARREGLPVEPIIDLLIPEHVERALALAKNSASDVIVPVIDFNDDYTRQGKRELQRQIHVKDIGFFPSLFPGFSVSTLLTYHSPNLQYLRLSAPDSETRAGQNFVAWHLTREKLPPRPVVLQSWTTNGVHPAAFLPLQRDDFFGSYTPSGGDANRGTVTIGPFVSRGPLSIGIPIITGPSQAGLSVAVIDHRTGAVIAELKPPPNVPLWAIWRVDVSPVSQSQFEVIGRDEGAGWGQWLGIGYPLRISEP